MGADGSAQGDTSSISETVKLSSGGDMPVMGFGTAGIKDSEVVYTAIAKAGYRHIDTATRYANEDIIGEALEKVLSEETIKREDLFVTTKLWDTDYADPEAALRLSL